MNGKQLPKAVLMVRPAAFGFNAETSATNAFQKNEEFHSISTKAVEEFDTMVQLLQSHDIDVRVFQDSDAVVKPDAVFPNNWVSFHPGNIVIIYPLMAKNRRAERRDDIIDSIRNSYSVEKVIDLSAYESEGKYLEGTGSLVFDHSHRKVYACRSPRTDVDLAAKVADFLSYTLILFNAVDENGKAIYHTNVVMSIGSKFAVVCLDAIKSEDEQEVILESLSAAGHQVVAISFSQMQAFAGNIIEVADKSGGSTVLMSTTAFASLLPGQINAISKNSDILTINIDTIQRIGGGSVRCMVAGIHLTEK